MRFKVTLNVQENKHEAILPLNYQYELSSWIYQTIHHGNPIFSEWLHSHGYCNENKVFKFFTFSNIHVYPYQIKGDRLIIKDGMAYFYISFYLEEAAEPFIIGVFKQQQFCIGDKKSNAKFQILCIERVVDPELLPTMRFKSVTPIVVSTKASGDSKYATYLEPLHSDYSRLFFQNLANKLETLKTHEGNNTPLVKNEPGACFLKILNTPRSKLIKIKAGTQHESQIKGYLFDFEITAPTNLLRLGYFAGFGEKNSMGFGCVECI